MPQFVDVEFIGLDQIAAEGGTLVLFAGADMAMGEAATALTRDARDTLTRAASVAKFKGKSGSVLDLLAPAAVQADRLLVVGTVADKALPGHRFVTLGGSVMGKLKLASAVTVVFDLPEATAADAADLMLGLTLRAYRFDRYKTKKKKDEAEDDQPVRIKVAVRDVAAVTQAAESRKAVSDGVQLARTLVNEPPNVLYPEEFARRAAELAALGVEIELFDEAALGTIGMGALLAVGQGSEYGSRVVVMRWNGAADRASQPIAFVGKGVCFDSGGISIKPGAGMEDMKGDMGGAACVTGLMHALAARKAKANVIGIIGLVENMPDGKSYRPGDILTSLSGQTIEVINTDAEGRLVLADLLWYVQDKFKPAFMVNLATLTGAIIVALGTEHAGLFTNNDELSQKLLTAGIETGEKVWRLPLSPSYDKLIDSKFADMKNTGGRHGGSITAAQFLQRFVNDTPWAHLDVAGTAMGAPADEINQSWAAGWGVRLLDRLVSDHYER